MQSAKFETKKLILASLEATKRKIGVMIIEASVYIEHTKEGIKRYKIKGRNLWLSVMEERVNQWNL